MKKMACDSDIDSYIDSDVCDTEMENVCMSDRLFETLLALIRCTPEKCTSFARLSYVY